MPFISILMKIGTVIRFLVPALQNDEWSLYDQELRSLLSPWHHHLSRLIDPRDVAYMGDQITNVINQFLREKDQFKEEEKGSGSHSSGFVSHKNKTLEEAKKVQKLTAQTCVSTRSFSRGPPGMEGCSKDCQSAQESGKEKRRVKEDLISGKSVQEKFLQLL